MTAKRAILLSTLLILSTILLSGCSILRQLGTVIGPNASLADAEVTGFSGLVTPITDEIENPDGTTRVLELGCRVAMAVRGEEQLRQILLTGKFADLCKTLATEVNSAITVNGQADGTGLFTPTRVNVKGD